MAWSGLNLTVEGRKALNQAQLNNRLNFKSIVVGDGNPPSNFSTQKQLVHQLYELTELKIDITENKCVLTADFPNVDYDYYFREIGIIVTTENGDKLYVYDNCGDDAQYIVTTTGTERTEKRLRLILMISDVEHITVSESSILYVAYDEYEKTITELKQNKLDSEGGDISDTIVKFTESQQTENICSGEKLGIIFSKIQKALKDCFVHITSAHVTGVKGSAESIYRTENVEITAENVGLGNVDNTADSAKSVNYAASAGNAAKVNGHSVNADVPSNAKFTDTNTWRPLGTGANDACAGNDSRLSNARPASDVYAWAKASTKPAYNKAEVGLGNVDNTADSAKSVNYAASAGNAAKVNGHSVNADVPSNAKFTDTNTWRPQPDWNATSGDAMIKNKPSLGTAAVKATRTLTSVGASGWQNVTSDQKYVPDMAFIAYWNGAYSGSSSNLTYCNKGAFGTAATANKTDFATANHIHSYLPLAGGTMTGTLNMNGNNVKLYGNNYMQANEQDINIIAAGKDMFTGYVNARVTSALQVRDTSNSSWKPVNALSFNQQSSARYKKNIANMTDEEALKLLKYRVVDYDYINEADGTGCQGLIAEEVAEICEYPVYRKPDGTIEGLDYSKFVPQLIKMVQIQQTEIDELRQTIESLKN